MQADLAALLRASHNASMSSSALTLTVNGRDAHSAAASLAALLDELGYGGQRVATAVNGVFVPERARAATALAEGDRIEVLSARQGG